MRRLFALLPVLAGTVMILLAVAANGRPSVFSDTDDYFEHGKNFAYAVAYALHLKAPPQPPTDPVEIADAQQAAIDAHMSHPELAARSPYYGLLLYGSQRIGTIWLLTAIQAAIGAWLIWLLWRCATPRAPAWTAYAVEGAAAFLSTLPFFASFAMPDVFGGYLAIAAILLIGFWERLRLAERIALAAVIAAACTFHGSHPLLALALAIAGGAAAWFLKAPRTRLLLGSGAVLGAVVAALGANAIYMQTVKATTGDTPGRPPFLAVRLLADGPGRAYLRYACTHGQTYALCRYRNLPLDDTDEMLWSDQKTLGVFNMSDYPTRLALEHEEMRFALGAIAYDPGGVLVAAIRNFAQQLTGVYVDDPLRDPHYYLTNTYWSTTNLPWLILHTGDCGRDRRGCKPRLDAQTSIWLHGALFVLALGLVLWRLTRADVRESLRARDWDADAARIVFALGLTIVTLLANAAICGVLSGPFPRYQARLVWLITVAAAIGGVSRAPALSLAQISAAWRASPRVAAAFARPETAWVLRRIDATFLRFALVGATGFGVDRLVLGADMAMGLNYFVGRLVSFSVALATTWLLNRSFTFRHPHAHTPLRQAAIYASVQVAGGALNVGAYTAAIWFMPALKAHLLIPLAIGSALGLCVTFAGSKRLAFPEAQARSAE